jgi:hypothetical protein
MEVRMGLRMGLRMETTGGMEELTEDGTVGRES